MGVDTSKDRKWSESFSIKFLNGIVLFVHRSTVLFLTCPLIGVLGIVCIPDIIALLLANVQLYFQYRRKLPNEWIGLKGFWLLSIGSEIYSIIDILAFNLYKPGSALFLVFKLISMILNIVIVVFLFVGQTLNENRHFIEIFDEEGNIEDVQQNDLLVLSIEIKLIKNRKYKNQEDNMYQFKSDIKEEMNKFNFSIKTLLCNEQIRDEKYIYEVITKKKVKDFYDFNWKFLEFITENYGFKSINFHTFSLKLLQNKIFHYKNNDKNENLTIYNSASDLNNKRKWSLNIKENKEVTLEESNAENLINDIISLKDYYTAFFDCSNGNDEECFKVFKELFFEFIEIKNMTKIKKNYHKLSSDLKEVNTLNTFYSNSNGSQIQDVSEIKNLNSLNNSINNDFLIQIDNLTRLLVNGGENKRFVFKIIKFNTTSHLVEYRIDSCCNRSIIDKFILKDLAYLSSLNRCTASDDISLLLKGFYSNLNSFKDNNNTNYQSFIDKIELSINNLINDCFNMNKNVIVFFSLNNLLQINNIENIVDDLHFYYFYIVKNSSEMLSTINIKEFMVDKILKNLINKSFFYELVCINRLYFKDSKELINIFTIKSHSFTKKINRFSTQNNAITYWNIRFSLDHFVKVLNKITNSFLMKLNSFKIENNTNSLKIEKDNLLKPFNNNCYTVLIEKSISNMQTYSKELIEISTNVENILAKVNISTEYEGILETSNIFNKNISINSDINYHSLREAVNKMLLYINGIINTNSLLTLLLNKDLNKLLRFNNLENSNSSNDKSLIVKTDLSHFAYENLMFKVNNYECVNKTDNDEYLKVTILNSKLDMNDDVASLLEINEEVLLNDNSYIEAKEFKEIEISEKANYNSYFNENDESLSQSTQNKLFNVKLSNNTDKSLINSLLD